MQKQEAMAKQLDSMSKKIEEVANPSRSLDQMGSDSFYDSDLRKVCEPYPRLEPIESWSRWQCITNQTQTTFYPFAQNKGF